MPPKLRPTPPLTGDLVHLEPLRADHVDALVAAAAEDRSTYGWTFVPDGRERMAHWVDLALAGREADLFTPFVTIRRADDRIVGSTRFFNEVWDWSLLNPSMQRTDRPDVVEIGATWLAASAQRTAINTEAKLLMLTHAFETLEVHRVCLRTDRRNERSRTAIARLGATFDGVWRADRPGADGTVRDTAQYSILPAEWPAIRQRLRDRLAPPA